MHAAGVAYMGRRQHPPGPWHWREAAFELDWSDFRRLQKAKEVAAEQVSKHAAAGRDQSVAALKFKRLARRS